MDWKFWIGLWLVIGAITAVGFGHSTSKIRKHRKLRGEDETRN